MKLDLHTHCFEGLNTFPTVDSVRQIVATVERKGLDGIAITEHHSFTYGLQAKEIIEKELRSPIILIPGREIGENGQEIVELILPQGTLFRFVAHPYPSIANFHFRDDIHGLEVENFCHKSHLHQTVLKKLASENSLVLLSNSDAHSLAEVGALYTEIDLKSLYRAVVNRKMVTLRRTVDWLETELHNRDGALEKLLLENRELKRKLESLGRRLEGSQD